MEFRKRQARRRTDSTADEDDAGAAALEPAAPKPAAKPVAKAAKALLSFAGDDEEEAFVPRAAPKKSSAAGLPFGKAAPGERAVLVPEIRTQVASSGEYTAEKLREVRAAAGPPRTTWSRDELRVVVLSLES